MRLMVDTNVFKMTSAHDLIIAAIARRHGLAVLTDDVAEFSRVPGLQVVPFTT